MAAHTSIDGQLAYLMNIYQVPVSIDGELAYSMNIYQVPVLCQTWGSICKSLSHICRSHINRIAMLYSEFKKFLRKKTPEAEFKLVDPSETSNKRF